MKRKRTFKSFVSIAIILLILINSIPIYVPQANAAVASYYFTRYGAGSQNGRGWANAYPADKFADILAGATGGESFYLAAATYHPKYDLYKSMTSLEQNKTFYTNCNVSIYGGYDDAGNRDVALNETILHGNGGYHVVVVDGNTALLDGLTITGGGNGIDDIIVGGIDHKNGGGVYANKSVATIRGCTIKDNDVLVNGGGIYADPGSSVKAYDCTFINNSALSGGGTYNVESYESYFEGNSASGGGAVNGGGVQNCTLLGNHAIQSGGALSGGWARNCTILNNSTDNKGGGISSGTDASVIGNIIAGNMAGSGEGHDLYAGAVSPSYRYNVVGTASGWTPNTDPAAPNYIVAEGTMRTILDYRNGRYHAQNNGGTTDTVAVVNPGAMIGDGVNMMCMPKGGTYGAPQTDQRGVGRKPGAATIGAWESAYAVYYNSQGGSFVSSGYGYHNSTITAPAAPTRTDGYGFAGWYRESDCTNAWNFITDRVTSPVTLYAKWEWNKYTVTFDLDGGTRTGGGALTQTVTHGSSATAPTAARDGYTFESWEGSLTSVSSNRTIKAIWNPNDAQLIFNPNGGTGTMNPQPYKTDETKNIIDCTFTRDGYDFAGWATSQTGKVAYENMESYMMGAGGTRTLYAVWTPRTNKVTFNGNGATGGTMSVQWIATDQTNNLTPNAFTKTGHGFLGWNTAANGSGTSYGDGASYKMGANENYTLFAQWVANPYNVVFDKNSTEASGTMAPQPITYNTSSTLSPNTYSRPGYHFTGWATGQTGLAEYNDAGGFLMDVTGCTLYAVWEPNVNIVEFHAGGGTGSMPNQSIRTGETAALTANQFTRAGYAFDGWMTAAVGTAVAYEDRAPYTMGADGTNHLYAKWTANLNTITFHSGNATGDTYIQTIATDASARLAESRFDKIGYRQAGWKENGVGDLIPLGSSYTMGPNANYNLYAVWEAGVYALSFDGNGVGVTGDTPPVGVTFDGVALLPECGYERPGYTFAGWAEREGGGVSYRNGDLYPMRTEGAVLYAVWTANTGTVTFHSNDGKGDTYTQSLKTDQTAILAANTFVRFGYTFVGWATNAGDAPLFMDGEGYVMGPQNNYDLYAVWRVNGYVITFDGNGATSGDMPDQTMDYDDTVELCANQYVRKGYTFVGWRDAADQAEYADQAAYTMRAEGAVLVAVWSANDNLITFNAGGGEGYMPPQTMRSDSSSPLDANAFARRGYTFAGWSTTEGGGVDYEDGDLFGMMADHVVLYAVWSANTYTLTFHGNGATMGNMQKQPFVYGIPAPLSQNAFVREGYDFVGWTSEQTAGRPTNPGFDFSDGDVYGIEASDAALYAVWKPRVYKVTFKPGTGGTLNGGTNDVVYDFYRDDGLVTPSTTPDAGYYFGGWDKPLELIVRGDAEYAALWTDFPVYGVTFDANGGMGEMPEQTIRQTMPANLYKNTFHKPGHTFVGWSVTPVSDTDVPEFDYEDGAPYTMGDGDVTLYAVWAVNYYRVEFLDYDGGVLKPTQSVKYEMAAVPPREPTRPGHTFAGWDSGYGKITADCTITATYAANENTITYNNGGGTGENYTQTIKTDQAARLLMNTFRKTGYEFVGWRENGNSPVLAQNAAYTMGSDDVTLYAVWTPVAYDLVFTAGGGSGSMPKIPVYFDGTAALPQCRFTRTGYMFVGWSDGKNVMLQGDNYTMATTGATLTALWEAKENKITLTSNGGEGEPHTVTAKTDEALTIKNQFTRKGYTFVGWAVEPGGRVSVPADSQYKMGVSDITLYAVWEADAHQIIFTNGKDSYTQTAKSDEAIKLVKNRFAKAGYTFAGWSSSRDKAEWDYGDDAAITMPTSSLTLYAVWSANTNQIVLNSNNGKGKTDAIQGKTDEEVTLPPCRFEKKGYAFSHWGTEPDGGTPLGADAAYIVPAARVTQLYAIYTPNQYKIKFDAGGGTGKMSSQTVTFDEKVTLPENTFTRVGYEFKQWTTDPAGGGVVYTDAQTFQYAHDGNATLYVVWEAVPGRILFEPGDGEGKPYTQSIRHDETKALLKCAFTREGYTFAGWSGEEGSDDVQYDDKAEFTMIRPSVTLYAVWKPNLNTITFDGGGANGGNMQEQKIPTDGTAILLPNRYSKDGFVFAGWSTVPDAGSVDYEDEAEYTMGTGDVTLYAVWKNESGTIVFDANAPHDGGMPNQTNEMKQRFTLIPNGFVREGYHFEGWSTTPDGQAMYPDCSEFILRDKTLVLYAVWKPDTNYVIFDACGGEGEDFHMQILTGQTKELVPGSFHKPGYCFAGWSTVSGFEGRDDPEEAMVSELPVQRRIDYADKAEFTSQGGNVRLYAVWEPNEYTIRFNNGYDFTPDYVQTATCHTEVDLVGNKFTRRGYTFVGWSTLEDGSENDVEYEDKAKYTMGVENVTLYAKWTPNEYLVIFDAGAPGVAGEMEPMRYTYDVLTTLTPCGFERIGYDFAGWSKYAGGSVMYGEDDDFMPEAKDTILYAIWQPQLVSVVLSSNFESEEGDDDDGDEEIEYSVYVGSTINVKPNAFKRAGHIFDGWSAESYLDGPEAVAGQQEYGEGMNFLSKPSYNVIFIGGDRMVVPPCDVVLYAQWKPDPNIVRFDEEDDVEDEYELDENEFEDEDYEEDESASSASGGLAFRPRAAKVAHAATTKYTVTIIYGNGRADKTHIVDKNKTVDNPGTPTRTGYTFEGWYKGDNKFDFSTKITSTTRLKAKWKIKTYTVTCYSLNSKKEYAIKHGVRFKKVKDNPTKTHYTFGGWYQDNVKVTPSSLTITSNVKLTARWTPKSYIVTCKLGNGSPDQTQPVTYKSVPKVTAPTKTGYDFKGWYNEKGKKVNPGKMKVAKNRVLTAKWTKKRFTVYCKGLNSTKKYTVKYNEVPKKINPNPKKKHYTFGGWYDESGSKVNVGSLKVTRERRLTAKWTPVTYTVEFATWELSDGTITPTRNEVRIQYPNTFDPAGYGLGHVSKSGSRAYTFKGWNRKQNKKTPMKAFKVNGNKKLYPVYEAQRYTITLYGNGGKARRDVHNNRETKFCLYGGKVKLNNPFVNTGATFRQWRDTIPESMKPGNDRYYYIDKGGKTYDDYIKFNERTDYKKNAYYHLEKPGDKNFYAVWDQNDVKILYYTKTMEFSSHSCFETVIIKAGQKFKPKEYLTLRSDLKNWNKSKNGAGDVYKIDETYRVFTKETHLYARYYYDEMLTAADKAAKVKVAQVSGTWYKDFSIPIIDALAKAETNFKAVGHWRNYAWFYLQVKSGADWDIKLKNKWNKTIAEGTFPGSYKTKIVVNGVVKTPEQLGNMTYGYLGTASGYTQFELLSGGDFADDGVRGVFKRSDSDDDKENVRLGIRWYIEIKNRRMGY